MSATHTDACPLDCPDACSLSVQVDGDRVTVVDGSSVNPVTGGFICAKVRRFPEAMYGPDRVLSPLIRAGRKGEAVFREATWDEALDRVAAGLAERRDRFGGESILPFFYGGSNGLLSQNTVDARLFRRLGATNLARTVCASATGRAAEGLYGKMAGVGYADYAEAKLIVVWGANPHVSGVHLVPFIQEAQKRGARLVVIDPRRTKLAWKSDLHLAPQPGTDLPLALAVINWLFEHGAADETFLAGHATGADRLREIAAPWNLHYAANVCRMQALEIENFARLYAESSPAVIRCGWGLERNRNGGSAAAAVLALPAVAGKFGVRGGGYTLSNSAAWGFSTEAAINAAVPPTRTLNMNKLGEALIGGDNAWAADVPSQPPIHALFVYNCNPLATMPRQGSVRAGLEREDLFTVVFDSFLTDTARYADVVLPAATFLERRELSRGYGAYMLHDAGVSAPPAGESRTNHEVFLELVKRLGLDEPGDPETEEAVVEAILAAHPEGDRLRAELARDGVALPGFGAAPVQFVDVFPRTADRKVHLAPEELEREAPRGLYGFAHDPGTNRYPLALISSGTNRTISSTLGQLHEGPVPLRIHPLDARERGIAEGDRVRVWNDLGEVRCPASLDADMRLGVVELPKGLWLRQTEGDGTANLLAPDDLTDLGAGACFNDARVQVERAGSA